MNITLIGMPGVGKSVIGKLLAKKLGYKFIDVDTIIEKNSKMKLQEIIDIFGDKEFLKIERKTILGLGEFDNCIISPGGSAVYSKDAMKFLKKRSIVVFLKISLKNLLKLTPDLSERGVVWLKKKGLKKIFSERLALYKKYADITINMPEFFDSDAITEDIICRIKASQHPQTRPLLSGQPF